MTISKTKNYWYSRLQALKSVGFASQTGATPMSVYLPVSDVLFDFLPVCCLAAMLFLLIMLTPSVHLSLIYLKSFKTNSAGGLGTSSEPIQMKMLGFEPSTLSVVLSRCGLITSLSSSYSTTSSFHLTNCFKFHLLHVFICWRAEGTSDRWSPGGVPVSCSCRLIFTWNQALQLLPCEDNRSDV